MKNGKFNKLNLETFIFLICGTAFSMQGFFTEFRLASYFDVVSPALAQEKTRINFQPDALYHKAWGIIKEVYYDQSFNGQDWAKWEHKYDGKLITQHDAENAIEAMLKSLGDSGTRLLNADAFTDDKQSVKANLFGVGMQLGMDKNGKVLVLGIDENLPAARAGLRPGDRIVDVDYNRTDGQSLDQVVKLIRGFKGTKVTITYLRGNSTQVASLVRAEAPIVSASGQMLPGGIGYIRLSNLVSYKVPGELRNTLVKLKDQQAKGLVLDLRNNHGGSIGNLIEIANMFIDRGVIVTTVDADGYRVSNLATDSSFKMSLPMIALVNRNTCGASELLAAALRDHSRAQMVGETTFGNGLLQAVNNLGNGAGLDVSVARCLTPNDDNIHKVGVLPNFEVGLSQSDLKAGKGAWWISSTDSNQSVDASPISGKDIQLNKAIELLKKQIVDDRTK